MSLADVLMPASRLVMRDRIDVCSASGRGAPPAQGVRQDRHQLRRCLAWPDGAPPEGIAGTASS